MNAPSFFYMVVQILAVGSDHLPERILVAFQMFVGPAEEGVVDGGIGLRLNTGVVSARLAFL